MFLCIKKNTKYSEKIKNFTTYMVKKCYNLM